LAGPPAFGEALDRQPLRAFQLLTLGLLLLALVIDGLDYQLLALVAPVILEEWAIERGAFGPAMAAALFGMAIGAAGGGWIGDRIGRLRVLVVSVVLFGAATAAASLAEGVAWLTVLRVIGGIGFGAAGPNAIALASEWMPRRTRSYVVALLAIGTPSGGMLGALLLPPLLPQLGWRGVFVLLGLLAIGLAVVLALVLRESPPWLLKAGREQAARAAARRILPQEHDWVAEAPAAAGTVPGRLFGRKTMRLNASLGLGFAALTAIVYGLGSWMPSFLTAAGFTLEQALHASFVFNACSIAGALAAGWLVRRQGSRKVILGASLVTGVLLAGFGLALEWAGDPPDTGTRVLIDGLAAGVGAAASVAITTLYTMAATLYPPAIRSSGIGLGMTMGRIGGILMSFAGGYLLDFAGGSAVVLFGVLALCALLVTAAGWSVREDVSAGRVGSAD
jgi:AAHS family 4-hydroxybenzoate transporter-like MFS transporter